jgi:hypothetical protein
MVNSCVHVRQAETVASGTHGCGMRGEFESLFDLTGEVSGRAEEDIGAAAPELEEAMGKRGQPARGGGGALGRWEKRRRRREQRFVPSAGKGES